MLIFNSLSFPDSNCFVVRDYVKPCWWKQAFTWKIFCYSIAQHGMISMRIVKFRQWKFHQVARWARGLQFAQGHSQNTFLCLRVTSEQGMKAQGHEGSCNCLFVPHCFSVQKVRTSSIVTCSVEVSPLIECTIATTSAFTEQQKAFIDPHHLSKILEQKPPINH